LINLSAALVMCFFISFCRDGYQQYNMSKQLTTEYKQADSVITNP
jgi:hypothetical protein